jgi:hypothetical protein
VRCPDCESTRLWKKGFGRQARQRYRCKSCGRSFTPAGREWGWTSRQVFALKQAYQKVGPSRLAKRLGKSVGAVSSKACRLGLSYKPLRLPKLSVSQLAYLAGCIDSEGWLGLSKVPDKSKHGYCLRPRLTISNTSVKYAKYLRAMLENGALCKSYNRKHSKGRWKPVWHIDFYEKALRTLLPKVLPYLIIKKPHAKLLMVVLRRLKQGHFSLLESAPIYFKLKHLNQRGPPSEETYSLPCPQDGTQISEFQWPVCSRCGDLDQWLEGG